MNNSKSLSKSIGKNKNFVFTMMGTYTDANFFACVCVVVALEASRAS